MKNIFLPLFLVCLPAFGNSPKSASIYHKGWIDFNKNGVKDIYEDPSQSVDRRIHDLLSQMTLEEKTCQLATLYGYKRVLKDDLPTPEWKNEVWKDGIANIDEHLNGLVKTAYSYPYSRHAEAINTVQRWFVENTLRYSCRLLQRRHTRSEPRPGHSTTGSYLHRQYLAQGTGPSGRRHRGTGSKSVRLYQCICPHTGCGTRPAMGKSVGMLR